MGPICLYAWARVGLGGLGVAKGREGGLGRGERLYGAKPLYILFGSHHHPPRTNLDHGLSSRDDEMKFMQIPLFDEM